MPFMSTKIYSAQRFYTAAARLACTIVCSIMLAGCAAQMAYRDGKDLVAQGKPEAALEKFQEALTHDPHNVEYRQALLQTRERASASFLQQADREASAGTSEEARKLYQRVLGIEPANVKALAGLKALDSEAHQATLLTAADMALRKKDLDLARKNISQVLIENPTSARALALRKSIEDMTDKSASESQLAKAYKKPITIEFRDVALKQIFEVISRTSGLNFLFDKEVKTDQKTSIFLKNSSIESAVHFVLLTNQLEEQVLDGNTVLIYPNTAAKQKDYQELAVRTFFLTNIEAKTMANTLKTIVKSRDIVVDEKLNMIIIRDTPDAIKMAEKLVALQDVQEPEVMLEVEVLEVQKTLLQNLGIEWPASLSVTPLPLGSLASSSTSGTTGTTTTTGTTSTSSTLSLHDLLHQNRNSLGVTVGQATANANLQDSDAKLLTNPRIRVRNHEKAKILIGERVPNITSTATSTGFVSQSINYIDIGLTLNVEPTIYLDDDVGIKVTLEVSSILNQITTQSGTSAYEIGTRTATTVLRLKNGETDVLAGLIDNTESHSGNKIPGIGDFPILGKLFGTTTDNDSKTEIVLSITPHLIRNIQRPAAGDAYFTSGTETSLRARPDSGAGGAVTVNTPITSSAPVQQNQPPSPAGATNPNAAASSSDPNGNSGLNGLNANNGITSAPTATTGTGDVIAGGAIAGTGVAQLQWQGPSQAKVGSSFSVSLIMQATQPVTSVPLTVTYDTTKLRLTNVAEGTFLKQAGAATRFTSSRVSTGTWAITDTTAGDVGATASAILTTLTFTALDAASPTDIQVTGVAPTGVGGVSITAVPPAAFAVNITN